MLNVDSRKARSEATQQSLMRAAEKLIADRGLQNVSIRDIVATAGQKNESALQYHFKNLSGLIDAILRERSNQTQAKRAELMDAMFARAPDPTLREICKLMVQPAYELARAHVDFRRYVKAFGHELVLTDTSPLEKADSHGGGGPSGRQVGDLLRAKLTHLDADAFVRRMEAAVIRWFDSIAESSG